LNGNSSLTSNRSSNPTILTILIPFLTRRKARVIVALFLFLAGFAAAQNPAYDPPAGYYFSTTGLSGSALKTELNQIIRGHTVIPYTSTATDVWDALKVLDEDPVNPANVVLIYTGVSSPKTDTNGDGNTTTTTASWEREHCWPKSFGISDNGADTSDLFNLRACRRSVNASRNNRTYAQAITTGASPAISPPNCPECLYDYDDGQGGIWTPRPSEKGDLARAIFYMAVRYDGRDTNSTDLEVADIADAARSIFSNLSDLLAWNEQDPVSETERRRNQLIYSQYQGNRNPFIDHPEMVGKIFGSVAQAPAIAISITPASVDEGSAATGTVSVSEAVTSSLVISLTPSGDPSGTEISIPSTVTLSSGTTSATFPVSALTDGVFDGDKAVTVFAAASGYDTGAAVVTVRDVDADPGSGIGNTQITGPGFYTQSFDSLPSSGVPNWADDSTLPGWYAQRTGSGTTILSTSGSTTIGGLYSYGSTSVDRALGSLGSGSAGSFAYGISFRNSTSATLTLTTLAYTGEQWRYSGTATAQSISFSYRIGPAAVTALTPGADTGWTAVSTLDFTSPIISGNTGALNGNAGANRRAISTNLNLQLAPGEWITLRWRDIDHAGGDHGLAIDDFRLDWTLPTLPPAPVITSPLLASGRQGQPFSYTITASGSPTFFEAESLPDGLFIDGTTGIISGTPTASGSFEASIIAGNAGGIDVETLTLSLDPALSPFTVWSGGAPPDPQLLQAYAIGGAAGPGIQIPPPTVAYEADTLILTAIVRIDDPGLTVVAEAVSDLMNYGNPVTVTEIQGSAAGVSQADVPSGCQRQEFRSTLPGGTRQFMRLRIDLQP
jgi:endonuclease I